MGRGRYPNLVMQLSDLVPRTATDDSIRRNVFYNHGTCRDHGTRADVDSSDYCDAGSNPHTAFHYDSRAIVRATAFRVWSQPVHIRNEANGRPDQDIVTDNYVSTHI